METGLSGNPIPDSHHVLRYCSPKHVRDGKIKASVFIFREGEDYVSVNWMEYFSQIKSADGQARKVCDAVGNKLTIRNSGRFAKLNVGKVRNIPDTSVEVRHCPESDDPSHSGIFYKEENGNIRLELANMINPDSDVFEVKQLRAQDE